VTPGVDGDRAFGFKEAQPAVEPAKLKVVVIEPVAVAGGVAGTGGVPVVQPGAAKVSVVAVLLATVPV
jgi:hypothetical protein